MKVRKNAVQKNVCLDMSMYNKYEIIDLLYQGRVFYIDENGVVSQDETKYTEDYQVRVSLNGAKEIKVEYNKFLNLYVTVVIQSDDTKLYVEL